MQFGFLNKFVGFSFDISDDFHFLQFGFLVEFEGSFQHRYEQFDIQGVEMHGGLRGH